MTPFFALMLGALPPIQSANDAVLQLRGGQVEAIRNVESACRGRLRHALKDEPRVVQALARLSSSGSADVKKAALDAYRCMSPARFVELMTPRLSDPDPELVAYAAEVSARVADPAVVPPLLDRLEAKRDACQSAELSPGQLDACVWLTYAPGASLAGAERKLRLRAAEDAAAMLGCPHAKVREVAVETLASARIKVHAKSVAELIAKEKQGAFPERNDAALLSRFETRRRALLKGD